MVIIKLKHKLSFTNNLKIVECLKSIFFINSFYFYYSSHKFRLTLFIKSSNITDKLMSPNIKKKIKL